MTHIYRRVIFIKKIYTTAKQKMQTFIMDNNKAFHARK